MKLQGVSVIFALIVLPLILVLTYYIQLQVDTIEMQKEYDKKLLDSTYGAMSAFEINTANEDLSSVSDSLRTIMEASTNIFMNTLATNLGMSNASKSYLEPYIPAILYTLYDGYYISAPTKTPVVLTDSDGNAVSVGDEGVGFNSTGNYYTYTEGNGSFLGYDFFNENEAKNNYGQLLYLKKGETDKYTTNVDEAEVEIKHILKTYMPYSARYKNDKVDIVAIYTLDNYLTIEGTIDEIYYTKSGYFIPSGSVNVTAIKDINNNDISGFTTVTDCGKLLLYNQNDAKQFIENGNFVEIELNAKEADTSKKTTITSGGQGKSKSDIEEHISVLNTIYDKTESFIAQNSKMTLSEEDNNKIEQFFIDLTNPENVEIFDFSECEDTSIEGRLNFVKEKTTARINNYQYQLDEMSAVSYYVTAMIFSNWINDNLVNNNQVQERHLVEISGQSYNLVKGKSQVSHDFSTSESPVFYIVGTNNEDSELNSPMEIDKDSAFYSHKLNVIRDSIQYNLNLAMTTYNNMLISTQDYAMPVMENEEWERILTNVSIVSFMQGYSCGLKTYNNYKIVSSTNNEISISPEEIYYVKKEDFSNENAEYHRIDCPKLFNNIDKGTTNTYSSFTSKEVKYDKLYDKTNALVPYEYDHKNLACYECINDGNYVGSKLFDTSDSQYIQYANLRKAYYIGVGKERNDLYKMNAITNSEGYEVIYNRNVIPQSTSTLGLNEIKSIEIVLDTIKTSDSEENVLNFTVSTTGTTLNNTIYTIVPNVTTYSTIKIDVDPTITTATTIGVSDLVFTNLFEQSTAYTIDPVTKVKDENADFTKIVNDSILFVKVIYR